MSFPVLDWVVRDCQQKGSKKLAMMILAFHADNMGECYPALDTLAREVVVNERQMRSILRALENEGEISVSTGGGRRTNTYRILGFINAKKSTSNRSEGQSTTPVVNNPSDAKNNPSGGLSTTPLTVENEIHEIHETTPLGGSEQPLWGVTDTPSGGFSATPELKYNIHTNTIEPTSKNYVVAPVGDNTAHTPSTTVSDNPTVTDTMTTLPTAETQPSGTIASTPVTNPKVEVPNPEPSTTIEESATSSDLTTVSDTEAHATEPPPVVPPRETRKRAKSVSEDKSQTGDKAPRTYSDQQKMVGAIASVFGWDMSKLTPSNRSLIGKVARDLLEASARPADVQGLYDFCKLQDWSSGFGPAALSSQWANYYSLKHQPLPDYIENEAGMIIYRFKPDPNYKSNIPEYVPSETGEFDYLLENIPETPEERKAQFENVLMQIVEKMNVPVEDIPEDDELNEVLKW